MKNIKTLLLASLFFGFLSSANATLVTQELISFDGANEMVIGSLQVDTNNGSTWDDNTITFDDSSIFTLTLNGFDIPDVWEVDFLEAALNINDLFAGFSDITFDLLNEYDETEYAYTSDHNEGSWDHDVYSNFSGITAFSETRLGTVSVVGTVDVPEPSVALILLLGLALISVKRKSF